MPKIPQPILSHHLTAVTLIWSAGTILFGYLAIDDRVWLHGMSVMVVGQWLTDSLDGTLGKYRKQGLVKWGFYMDHLLDFVFAGSIVIAYYGIGPTEIRIGYIALNTFVFFVGTEIFSWGVPVVLGLNLAAFLMMATQTSRNLWQIDYDTNVDNAPRP